MPVAQQRFLVVTAPRAAAPTSTLVAEEGEGVKSQFSSFENNGASFAASMNNLFSMAYTAENEED